MWSAVTKETSLLFSANSFNKEDTLLWLQFRSNSKIFLMQVLISETHVIEVQDF